MRAQLTPRARPRAGAVGLIAAAISVVAILSGCSVHPAIVGAAEPVPAAEPTATTAATEQRAESSPEPSIEAESTPSTFVSVVDGDTIETSAGTVRLIGIDTPERGECGDAEASGAIADHLSPGDDVVLGLPTGQNDRDRYGRLIRYVTTGAGVDLGLMQLQAGHAVARFDSFEGYPVHPREREYRATQRASLSADGSVITVACDAVAAPIASAGERWWELYSSCTKLKANGAGDPTGPFRRDDAAQAEAYDWFANRTGNNGDGDGDGLACE